MTANTTLNVGTGGDVIATDDFTTAKAQRVKLMLGATGIDGGNISPSNPVPVYFPPAAHTSKSGAITTGGVAQVLAAANTSRKGFCLQNLSAGNLYINVITTAAISNGSLLLTPGSYYESPFGGCSGAAISIIGPTTGQSFFAEEW